MNAFELQSKISLDTSSFFGNLRKSERGMKDFGDKLSSGFEKIQRAAKWLISGYAAKQLIGFTKSALDARGKLEQSLGGVQAVFGDYWYFVNREAQKAYENLGLSQNAYLEIANKIGSLLQGSGFTAEKAAETSIQVMQRASDVASIMGIDVQDAMTAIAGAAKGNFTMMDNLGVAMNTTTLEAYALSKGITKSYNSMTQAEKVGLAYDLFLEKTAKYAGNYAKENNTYAGSINTLKAAWENFMTGEGTADAVVESAMRAGKTIYKNLKILVPTLARGFSDMIKTSVKKIKWPTWDNVKSAARNAWNTIKDGVAKLGGLVFGKKADGTVNWPTWKEVGQKAREIWKSIKSEAAKLTGLVFGDGAGIENFKAALESIKKKWTELHDAIEEKAIDFLSGFTGKSPEEIEPTLSGIATALEAIGVAIVTYTLGTKLAEIFTAITTFFASGLTVSHPVLLAISALAAAGVLIYQNWDGISEFFFNLWEGITKWATAAYDAVKEWWEEDIVTPIKDRWNAIVTKIQDVVEDVKAAWNVIVTWFEENIINPISDTWDGVLSGVNSAIEAVKIAWSGIVDWFDKNIIDPIRKLWNGVASSGFGQFIGLSTWGDTGGNADSVWVDAGTGAYGPALPKASGMSFVPENGYLAELHFGEAVLSRNEAEKWRRGESGGGSTAELVAMVQKLEATIANLRLQVNGRDFGHAVADYGGSRVKSYIGGADRVAMAGYGTR